MNSNNTGHHFNTKNDVHILTDSVKIVIEQDPACNMGTKFQYILTRDSFMHVYRKDELITTDTVMGSCSLPPGDTLSDLMDLRFEQLTGPPKDSECRLTFTYFRGNRSKTVFVDDKIKNPIVDMAIAYINYLQAGSDKYIIGY